MRMECREKLIVSADMGCSTSDLIVAPFYKDLQKVFREFLTGSYFSTLGDLSIILRVSGELADFGGEGPERLKYAKRDRHITIDFVIPESRWRDVDTATIREYLADGVEWCFELLVKRALKAKELVDENTLRADFETAMRKFRSL